MSNTVAVRRITPDDARELLAKNDGNRHLRLSYIRYLARQIRDGNWQLSTDAVGLRADGRLANGQHRLHAIILANMPADVLFVDGLSEESFRILDVGVKRSAADALCITSVMAADCALIARLLGRDTVSRVPNHVIADIVSWWSPIHETLREASGNNSKGLSNAAVRVGVGVQWAAQSPGPASRVYQQYAAFMANDPPAMNRATATLWKRLSRDVRKLRSSPERVAMAVQSWHCFDPRRAKVEPIIKNMDASLAAFKAEVLALEAANETAAQAELKPLRTQVMEGMGDWRHRAKAQITAAP